MRSLFAYIAGFPHRILRGDHMKLCAQRLSIHATACSLAVFFIFSLIYLPVFAEAQTMPHIEAKSAILMEASTGRVLGEINADEALPPASVTKIMTLLLVMEALDAGNVKLDDIVTASANAASMGGSQIYLKEGEQMTVDDLLKSVVVASANDAAVALAEHICGSESVFVARMNARAAELGMLNTNFENTNGLDDTVSRHLTSARDIALMSRALIAHPKILEYSSIWMDSIREGAFGLTNTNRLIRFYRGATGLKTGSTSRAGFCISATAEREGMHLVAVIMGAPTRDVRNEAAKTLLDWGFSNYCLYRYTPQPLDPITVSGGVRDTCSVRSADFAAVLPRGGAGRVICEPVLPQTLSAPIGEGQPIGEMRFFCDGELIGTSEIICEDEVERIGFRTLFSRVFRYFLFA